ncbi:type III-A CRISPR-associated protein Cas10/Csm1 [Megamonas hypermegale]|uniref:type III-A CRISPR-associated protein Cas10/Csm1 n=1 Tax=Megamonas hypermegale TaxID=158847 RepID=UPI0026EFC92C|nr:type III-A CRISPR-associated protein Cas10/Csm1 [Megamonas hypermegale]
MNDMEILMKGALWHDVGKVCYRAGKKVNHSQAGADFLGNYLNNNAENNRLLNCVRYHHADYLKQADIQSDDLAYIVYEADNIAASMDRRDNESDTRGFDRNMALESVFNIFDGKAASPKKYNLVCENSAGDFNYPSDNQGDFSVSKYAALVEKLKIILNKYDINNLSINQTLQIIEKVFRYVPSSTNRNEVCDISLYVHSKITAAVAACLKLYFAEHNITDYKKYCYNASIVKKFRNEKVFQLISGDISGIQNFIYTIPTKGALKSLRGRSFYLEIFLENFIDELLSRLNLSRANLLYCGGGHFYVLAPATKTAEKVVEELHCSCNEWLLSNFGTKLYLAVGRENFSANELMQKGEHISGSIFSAVNRKINQDKTNYYNETLLKELFAQGSKYTVNQEKTRECSICHNSSMQLAAYDDDKLICPICAGLYRLGENILKDDSIFLISREKQADAMPIFGFSGDYYLYAVNEAQIGAFNDIVRIYSKNTADLAKDAIRLWIADYCARTENDTVMIFDELAQASCQKERGIKRLGVLRADVDNLGTAFIGGFIKSGEADKFKYATISRYANLSEDLSMFFKYAVNNICAGNLAGLDTVQEKPFNIFGFGKKKQRNIHVIYSGGDDVFLVGAWDDLLETAVDIYKAFQQFTGNRLTFSAGMAMFTPTYPISKMAEVTGMLEEASKNTAGKNSIALFGFETGLKDSGSKLICKHIYKWDEFINGVCRDKLNFILAQLDLDNTSANKLIMGKSAVYNFMRLLQLSETEAFNLARFAYVLARMQPKDKERLGTYERFAQNVYKWIRSAHDKKQLCTALNLLVYYLREKE